MQCDELKSFLLNRQTAIKLGSAIVLTGLISYLKFRPIAILVSSIYATWIYRTFYSGYHVQIPKELTHKCKNIYDNLKELRERRPNIFCGFITSMLFLLAVIGQVVNGTYILLVCLIAGVFITSKYEIKLYKEENDATPSGVDVDEFCPQMDETNFMILKQIGDHADDSSIFSATTGTTTLLTEDNKNESDSDNDLLPRNAIIPEPDEIDAMDENDLIIDPIDVVLTQSAEYKRKHFSNTSSESSDSDDSITRGLSFKNIPVTASIEPHSSSTTAESLLTNIQQTIARNLIENIIAPSHLDKPKSSQKKIYDSEDDSDFEILDSEDIPK